MTMTNKIPNTGVRYEWVAVKDIAEIYNVNSSLLMYHAKFQGLASQKIKGINFVRSCDIEILKMCIARSQARIERRKDPLFAHKAELRHRGYENKKRKALGMNPLPRLEHSHIGVSREEYYKAVEERQQLKQKQLDIDLIFEYKDRIKRGRLIGGNIKTEFKTALFRFVNTTGHKEIASVPFEKVHCDAAELENYIVKLHKVKLA